MHFFRIEMPSEMKHIAMGVFRMHTDLLQPSLNLFEGEEMLRLERAHTACLVSNI